MQPHDLSSHFLTWQCRIRQIAMREDNGRPSQGMCPQVQDVNERQISPGIVVLMIRENPIESTEFLKFQVQKYNDPQDVYKKSLTYLQSTHYHRAIEFSDELTALFGRGSTLARKLLEEQACILQFNQFQQNYTLPCTVRLLNRLDPAYQATLWHNRVFNPSLGDDVEILGFLPDWAKAAEMLKK